MTGSVEIPANATNSIPLLVIGAGPHALALVTRLLEPYPEATVNEEQHERLTRWRNKLHHEKSGGNGILRREDIMVVDPSGTWMQRWKQQFAAFRIERLRSPSFFHPDP
jgi:hypothetical protein